MKRFLFLPVVVAAGLAVRADDPKPSAPAASAGPAKIDFEKFAPGKLPDEFMVVEGEFKIADDGGNKVLELEADPIADGAVLFGQSLKGAGTISARIKAGKGRRAFPRFGVGLHGISGTKLRVVPAQKQIEIAKEDDVLAKVDFAWTEDQWLTVELTIKPAGAAWVAEGRIWTGDAKRPEAATITVKLDGAPGQGKGSVIGTPYAGKPVLFDDVLIVAGP